MVDYSRECSGITKVNFKFVTNRDNCKMVGFGPRWLMILWMTVFTCVQWATGQRPTSIDQIAYDSTYLIQFTELTDSISTFQSLKSLGKIVIDYIPSKRLYRYHLGYYTHLGQAESVLKNVRAMGFKEAFLKKQLIIPSPKTEIIGSNNINKNNSSNNKGNTVNTNKSKSTITNKNNITSSATKKSNTQTVKSTKNSPAKKSSTSPGTSSIAAGVKETGLAKDTITPKEKNVQINLLYTGKSFGVLGNTRFQAEHDLATEFAVKNQMKFKLVSHACWRAQGITVFLPSDEPEGNELELILKNRNKWQEVGPVQAYTTHNVMMFQIVDKYEIDLMHIVLNNKKISNDYPEIKKVPIKLYRTFINNKVECLIVEETNASWPTQLSHWAKGEINRVDIGKSDQLFELPVNQGGFGERATIIKKLTTEIKNGSGQVIKIDMGHRNADFSVTSMQRGRIDFTGLDSLGYSILVPYEFELLLGTDSLNTLAKEHPTLTLMSSNVQSPGYPALFTPFKYLMVDSIRIGLMAFTDPTLETNLPGKILKNIKFEDIVIAANKTIDSLRRFKPDIIIALSNMSIADNARLVENIKGINLISANFTDHAKGWTTSKEITVNRAEKQGAGAPYALSAIRDFGIEIGRVELKFVLDDTLEGGKLHALAEKSYKVSDRTASDVQLMDALTKAVPVVNEEQGDLLFPAFIDLIEQKPELADFDETTKKGRISKPLWEKFIARILTHGAPAEIAIIRKIPTFLPLIGKLHEREVRSWLWFEDEIVMMDMKGADIIRLLEADNDGTLTTSGIEALVLPKGIFYRIMGRPVQNDVYYRVATTNVISNGVLKEYFREGLREESHFEIQNNGELKGLKSGPVLPLRDYVLSELRRLRSYGKGKEHHARIAELLVPKRTYPKLFSFNFDRPTLWTSFNRTIKSEGYEAIPESRIISQNSFVLGTEGGILASLDMEKSELNFGSRIAFAQQSVNMGNGLTQKTENADDINVNITFKYRGRKKVAVHPYTRIEYDSEFTPTINRITNLENARQKILRNVLGISRGRTIKWPILELGLNAENDFSNSNYQYGIQGRSLNLLPLDKNWNVIYSLSNNFYYYLPNQNDSERDLSFKYNMVHEVLIPLFGDISLTMAADLFFFKGKTELNKEPGMNMLMKVGLSYNRLWKPKFQTLF